LGHPRGRFSVDHTTIVKKVVPFSESCPGTHTGYRIFLSHGNFAFAVGWISRQYIHHYFAKIKADFINAMTIRYVGQNMLQWNMGGNFNFIEQQLIFCARDSLKWVYDIMLHKLPYPLQAIPLFCGATSPSCGFGLSILCII
jgi:hypothetical protein